MTRRTFLETTALAGASALAGGCCCTCCKTARYGKIALQLYSLGAYTDKVGFEKTLADVRKIGFEGVEFAGYHGWDAKKLKEQLAANGLVVCGTHVPNSKFGFDTKKWTFDPEVMKKTCEFELSYGNNLIICPGEGNFPPGCTWTTGQGGEPCTPSKEIDDFAKRLADIGESTDVELVQFAGEKSYLVPVPSSKAVMDFFKEAERTQFWAVEPDLLNFEP